MNRYSQLGAALAHREAWIRATELDGATVILESDGLVSEGGWEHMNEALAQGHDLVWMPRMLWGKRPKEDTLTRTGANTRASGAWAYALTPKSAGTMIKHGTPVTTHADMFLNVATELPEIRKPIVFNPRKRVRSKRAVR